MLHGFSNTGNIIPKLTITHLVGNLELLCPKGNLLRCPGLLFGIFGSNADGSRKLVTQMEY